jgi:K+-sensing histidine kinase KdpD
MDQDGALEDFKNLVTAATEIFNTEIKIDKNKLELKRNVAFKDSNSLVTKSFEVFEKSIEKIENRDVLEKANKFLKTVKDHSSLMKERMETVEDLAGLGMAVEKASHDAMMLLAKMRGNIKDFQKKAKNKDYKNEELIKLLSELDENLNFVYDEMQVIQPLFKIQRKAIQDVSVYDNIEKVVKYFRRELENKISVQIIKDKDIVVITNNGLILQVLINLLDNAIYWVNRAEKKTPEIAFKINSKDNTLIIADNGAGIREDVEPLIFNEFFSLKSDGRGLGLYILKEILLRINAEISIIHEDNKKLLPGANFIIKFNNEPQ